MFWLGFTVLKFITVWVRIISISAGDFTSGIWPQARHWRSRLTRKIYREWSGWESLLSTSSFRAAYGCPQLVFFPGFDSFFRFKRDRSMWLWTVLQRIKICPSWTFILVLAFTVKQFCLVGILRPIPYARARNHSEVASDVVESRKHLGHQLQQQIIISRKQAFCITSNKARQFQPPWNLPLPTYSLLLSWCCSVSTTLHRFHWIQRQLPRSWFETAM